MDANSSSSVRRNALVGVVVVVVFTLVAFYWQDTKRAEVGRQEAPPANTATKTASDVPPSEEPLKSDDATAERTPEEFELTEADALLGSIKSVSCFQERAGTTELPSAEMAPPNVAVQAMEGCLDLTAARFKEHHAIELTIVYYLNPDGTVNETGIGADVATAEAWEIIEPCAREYWLANPMKVSASDEKSFSCVFNWSTWSVAGGVGTVGAKAARVLSGRDAAPFGASMTVTP